MARANQKRPTDTIFAEATGLGKAAVAVFRISGSDAPNLAARLTKRTLPSPKSTALRKIFAPESGDQIDEVLVLYFEAGASFTGDHLVELHCHGGTAVRRKIEAALIALGARPAAAGEFTRRRFDAGLLDLSQAEAVAALVDAETEAQHRLALRVMDGEVGRLANAWRRQFIDAAALLEVGIDFVDEEVGDDTAAAALAIVDALSADLQREKQGTRLDELALEAPTVALLGPPNAGKSTLLNLLTRRDLAIVTDIPGTTRDPIRGRMTVQGVTVELIDTAGLRDTIEPVEEIGVSRSRKIAKSSDFRIFVFSRDTWDATDEVHGMVREGDLGLWTKADIWSEPAPDLLALPFREVIPVSMYDTATIEQVVRAITELVSSATIIRSPLSGSKRRIDILDVAIERLDDARRFIESDASEAAVESLRDAIIRLEALIGRVRDEDVLDAVFSRFCIGK